MNLLYGLRLAAPCNPHGPTPGVSSSSVLGGAYTPLAAAYGRAILIAVV